MFASYLIEQSAAQYTNRIMIHDRDDFEERVHVGQLFKENGFRVLPYIDDLHFRVEQYGELFSSESKIAVIVKPNQYIPYDIQKCFSHYTLSFAGLFPRLNASTLKNNRQLNLDLLVCAYVDCFSDLTKDMLTEQFVEQKVYSKLNVEKYLSVYVKETATQCKCAQSFTDWTSVAEKKAEIDVLATEYDIPVETDSFNKKFCCFVQQDFGKLSSIVSRTSPVTVSRAMEYMHEHSDKFVIIVMDGMSEFDWTIIKQSFAELKYEQTSIFAMIPTTTSVSRQCLLSNKYPSQLLEPWKQSKEKQEFCNCAKGMGYSDNQIGYERGYDACFGAFVKCGAVIINDIDDMVHGQQQGRIGMFNDVTVLARQGKLIQLTKRLLRASFDVYISADHGNTPCIGMGKLMNTGVEVETKSRRMLVLKNYADKAVLLSKYSLIDYLKYYLNKDYDYLICDVGFSFDAKGESVMSHGGISLDEAIVPFIKIKAAENDV